MRWACRLGHGQSYCSCSKWPPLAVKRLIMFVTTHRVVHVFLWQHFPDGLQDSVHGVFPAWHRRHDGSDGCKSGQFLWSRDSSHAWRSTAEKRWVYSFKKHKSVICYRKLNVSVYFTVWLLQKISCKNLMHSIKVTGGLYTANKTGESTEPFLTPNLISNVVEIIPSHLIHEKH